jgi:DNA-binding NarL/FixJ family response regulator
LGEEECKEGLASAEGLPESLIAEQLETNRKTVRLWRTR